VISVLDVVYSVCFSHY